MKRGRGRPPLRVLWACPCGAQLVLRPFEARARAFCGQECAAYQASVDQSRLDDAARILRDVHASARHRGLECTLTLDDIAELRADKPCSYCGDEITSSRPRQPAIGLDRIDNDRGYHRDNVIACCSNCNVARGRLLSVDEFRAAMAVRLAGLPHGAGAWDGQRKTWRTKSSHAGRWKHSRGRRAV